MDITKSMFGRASARARPSAEVGGGGPAPLAGPVVEDVQAVRAGAEEGGVPGQRDRLAPGPVVEGDLLRGGLQSPGHEALRDPDTRPVDRGPRGAEQVQSLRHRDLDARPLEDLEGGLLQARRGRRAEPVPARRRARLGHRASSGLTVRWAHHPTVRGWPVTRGRRQGPSARFRPSPGRRPALALQAAGRGTGSRAAQPPNAPASSAIRSGPTRQQPPTSRAPAATQVRAVAASTVGPVAGTHLRPATSHPSPEFG